MLLGPVEVEASYNTAMRKRKRWIIGLLVVFLALCVGMWRWSEQVPYAFMEGSKTVDFFVGNSTVIEFRSPLSIQELKTKADAEMIPNGWERQALAPEVYGPEACDYIRPWPGDPNGADHVWIAEQYGKAIVTVQRRITPSDRIKAWLFNIKNR